MSPGSPPAALDRRWEDSQLSLLAPGRHNREAQEGRAEVRGEEPRADLIMSFDG